MKNKGIAVRMILLLVVGVLVAGVVIYMVYRYSVGGGETILTTSACRSRLVDACIRCMTTGWSETYPISSQLTDTTTGCAKYPEFSYWSDNTYCNSTANNIRDECKALGIT